LYRVPLKSAIVEALQQTFGPAYPQSDFRDLHVSIEFPDAPQDYPGIWVNYEDTEPLRRAGIDQREIVQDANGYHEVTRWRFAGSLSFTIGAFSSLERDRLFDELVGVFSFANVDDTQISTFKTSFEQNDFLGINVQYDILTVSGDATNSGTPWGTDDEIIYEITLSTDVIGEYVSDPATNQLVLLSDILVEGYRSDQPKPDFPDQPPITGVPYDPSQWI
jgi:hypothetical protein